MKVIAGSFIVLMLVGCGRLGDTVIKRGGDNTGFKDWAVEQTIQWRIPK